jgi:hypothetical protein
MAATLDDMGYRGEDVPSANGDRGRQQPWQPSSGMAPGDTGAWDDGSRGYAGDDGYPAANGGGYGYGPDGGYPGQGQQGYGPQDGQYGDPYAQQPYTGYGPGQGQGGYGGPQSYPGDDHGYDRPAGYEQRGYDQHPAPGYGSAGYRDPNAGYGRSGSYPVPPGGSGAYPALPSGTGGHPVEDAGNDWYSGQPAAANGASFADTGTYALNGRAIDEYGTGPRSAMRDPVRGYPPGPGQQGTGPLSVPARRALPATPPPSRTSSQPVAETRQQARLDDSAPRPGRAPSGSFTGPRRAPSGSFTGPGRAPSGSLTGAASGGFPGNGTRDTSGGRDVDDDYQDDVDALSAPDDPYQERFESRSGPRSRRGGARGAGGASGGRPTGNGRSGKRLLLAAVSVVVVGIVVAAAYVFLLKPSSSSSGSTASGPLPTGSTQPSLQACEQKLGTYCHIETAADDPKPLTVAELYPPAITNPADKQSYSLVSTKLDTTCSNAVIGADLIKALQAGKCTQVVRASYVSGDGKIMGTIGVVNLSSTNEAHHAGKVVGENDFVAPLTSKTGVASKLGNGTGVVGADYKGHYLILTWSEYVNGTVPATKAQDAPLDQFSSDLVNETANTALTQRMVTGAPSTPGAAS